MLAAREVVPVLLQGPPGARPRWLSHPGDVLSGKWLGRTLIDRAAAEACLLDELLLIEVGRKLASPLVTLLFCNW